MLNVQFNRRLRCARVYRGWERADHRMWTSLIRVEIRVFWFPTREVGRFFFNQSTDSESSLLRVAVRSYLKTTPPSWQLCKWKDDIVVLILDRAGGLGNQPNESPYTITMANEQRHRVWKQVCLEHQAKFQEFDQEGSRTSTLYVVQRWRTVGTQHIMIENQALI